MRHFLIIACAMMVSLPAFAQEAAEAPADETATRTELAAKMHEIWPVAARVEEAINVVAEDIPVKDRDSFKSQMRKAIDQKKLEEESIAAMAKTFTGKELQAMVDFYGSPEGRAVSAKTEDYMKILQPIMVKMLDNALLKMRTGAPLQSTPQDAP